MDEYGLAKLMMVFALCIVGFILAISSASYIIGENVIYSGYVVDTDYSQSGFGSSDITVVYFENETLIIHDVIEIDRNKYVEIIIWESPFIEGNRFVDVKYPNIKSR